MVVLANKSQIGVAADQRVLVRGKQALDQCKILRHGDFFFTFAGRVQDVDSRLYDARNILIQASRGLTDLTVMDKRFDDLVMIPLQKQIDHDFQHDRHAFLQQHNSGDPYLEIIIFRVTLAGSEMVQSVFPISLGKTPKVGQPFHHSCKAGVGECHLTAGMQDGMKEYFDELPPTNDLAADAERLVKFEANRHPNEIGGKITVLLIDGTGVHSADTNDKCPINWVG